MSPDDTLYRRIRNRVLTMSGNSPTLRFGGERYAVRSGDVIVCPAGGAKKAHQLINTSAGELRYLSISSMNLPEFAEYPNSTKFEVYSVTAATSTKISRINGSEWVALLCR